VVLDKYGIPSKTERFVVMTLGRLAKGAAHKGYDRLIRSFARFLPSNPSAALVVAGRGEMQPELEAQAASLGVSGSVKFIGSVNEEDLPDVYRAASVFSLVSDRGYGRGEGIPLTPLEAMSCEAPIIVGNHDGSREAVVDGRNGFVVDPFDEAGQADILAKLASSPALRADLARGARQVAVDLFGFPAFRAKHARVWAEIRASIDGR
jgi:phosphatidylinositol alpha-1,6-mannosyltransferase